MRICYGCHPLMLQMIYYWYLESVCFAHVYSSAIPIVLCSVLTVAVCLVGFWYAIGGQHMYTAAMQHRKEMENKNHPLPTWTKEFEAFEIKCGTPLPIGRQLAGLHQVQTTSNSM